MTTTDRPDDRSAAVRKARDDYHKISSQLDALMSQGRPLTPSEGAQADDLITHEAGALAEWRRAVRSI